MTEGKLNGLDLFSGIAGISVALSEWVRTVAYCEQDRYAQGVLLSRMQSGDIDRAPIWDDVRTLRKEHLPRIDIIYGGFPCQDISVAGNGVGLGGERSGLFFEIVRLAEEIRPTFIFLENVPAIRTRGLNRVGEELARLGYDCRWDIISAAEVGAPHLRKRWFLLAYSNGANLWHTNGTGTERLSSFTGNDGAKESVAHANSGRRTQCDEEVWAVSISNEKCSDDPNPMLPRLEGQREESSGEGPKLHDTCDNSWWTIEPDVGRVVNGLPPELDFFIFNGEKMDETFIESSDTKTVAEIDLFNREILRKMWEYRELAASSPELYFRRLHDSLPTLPQRPAHLRENLGQRISQRGELQNMWGAFYTETKQAEQIVRQSHLLKRIWQIKCEETMAKSNRVDRIKCLGNSVVPSQAKKAFKKLIGIQ